jgi:hypothetical protein
MSGRGLTALRNEKTERVNSRLQKATTTEQRRYHCLLAAACCMIISSIL